MDQVPCEKPSAWWLRSWKDVERCSLVDPVKLCNSLNIVNLSIVSILWLSTELFTEAFDEYGGNTLSYGSEDEFSSHEIESSLTESLLNEIH